MIELVANLWEVPAQVRCITTNGTVMASGKNVMGGGCAREAAERYPELPLVLGNLLKTYGNHVQIMYVVPGFKEFLVAFPTKDNVVYNSYTSLIARSCRELVFLCDRFHFDSIVIPRPGAGLGGLEWDDVKPICEQYLDDRFTIVSF